MRHVALLAIGLGFSGAATAHDFWLQPAAFSVAPNTVVPVNALIGHGAARQRWAVGIDRVVQFKDVSASGTRDRRAELRLGNGAQDALLALDTPGTHILVLESTHAISELPSLRFNNYLAEEGLTPALALRARAGSTDTGGREIYSRRAKALVQVGPAGSTPQPQVTRPLGLTLEIVPQKNPYMLAPAEALPVQVLYEGKPLAGALVKLINLDFDARPLEMRRTDAAGLAAFKVPRQGKWLLNVVWTKPIAGNPNADFDTTFSSLTFGFGGIAPAATAATPTASPARP